MKNALVTGAGVRLGRAMAIYLGDRGFDVAVHYRNSEKQASEVASQITRRGGRAVILKADLLVETDVQNLLPRAAEALGGPITCLVNNASIFEPDDVATATRESWDRSMGSNLRAPFVLTQAMAAQGLNPIQCMSGEACAAGLIVNMIDQRVRNLTPEFITYTMAKVALWGMTKTTAQALGPAIRVNGIGPGPTLKSDDLTDAQYADQRAGTILSRGSNLEDITAALGYFLDAPAVTGQLICADAGQHLEWQ
jgi:NAD(P)-dependent dehydrogenase (short-subunit alcohol dehydrogenase family)